MHARLVPLDGGKTIPISNAVTLVGRRKGLCDVCINAASVSKLQCLIVKTDGLLFVRDLGSTNGTKVNGQRITRGALLPGDELSFAGAKFRVELGPGDPEFGQDEPTEFLSKPPEDVENADEFEEEDSDVPLLSDDRS